MKKGKIYSQLVLLLLIFVIANSCDKPEFEEKVYIKKFAVSTSIIDFGETNSTCSFSIINEGDTTLDWTIVKGEETTISFSLESGTIKPYDSVQILASIDRPYLYGPKKSKITIVTSIGNVELNITIDIKVPNLQINSDNINLYAKFGEIKADFTENLNHIVSEVGFCWNTSGNPTINDNHTVVNKSWEDLARDLSFTGKIGVTYDDYYGFIVYQLNENTTYYIRAYFINASGIHYSNQIMDKTMEEFEPVYSTVSDFEGHVYKTVLIGEQWWFAENIKSTYYSDGEPLVDGTQELDFEGDVTTKYFFSNEYPPNGNNSLTKYGRYYTFAAVMNNESSSVDAPSGVQGICPTGWHVPSKAEFQVLLDFISTYGYSAPRSELFSEFYGGFSGIGMEQPPNRFGFSLLYGGVRGYDMGSFAIPIFNYGLWLSDGTSFSDYSHKHEQGLNVRCVKD